MAASPSDEEPGFRFIVKIMPPRRPTNSLFRRLQAPKPDEPLYTIAVPTRSSETFADVWKHIKERYERNYTAEEVAKGWFHKLQDRFGADIDSSDGVGELGYTPKTPSEDLVLVMLQNAIDRDGSVPDTSGLRPSGFTRPVLNAEQEQQAKRRKIQEERYGAALEDVTEDTPLESRERSLGPGSPELGGQSDGDPIGGGGRKIDADGFAVPTLPGSVTRKRKRSSRSHADGDVIQSSMEGENDEDILAQDSQTAAPSDQSVTESTAQNAQTPRSRIMHSVPPEATAASSNSSVGAGRAQTTAPRARANQTNTHSFMAKSVGPSSSKAKTNADRPGPPPTPKPASTQAFTQQPPESAQRPKPTPSTPAMQTVQRQTAAKNHATQDETELDPIEDDDLLLGITGTADNDFDETAAVSRPPIESSIREGERAAPKSKPGKLPKPNKKLALTPGAKGSHSKQLALTPGSNAFEVVSGTQDSAGKNPRSQSFTKNVWTSEEDSYLLQGLRKKLTPLQTLKKYELPGRTASAVRGRRKLLLKKHPDIAEQKGAVEEDDDDDDDESILSTSKKPAKRWSAEDVHTMSRAISRGYDALEILAMHFPTRSEDAVIRKVLALQNQVWKNAAKDPMFPHNDAELEGWTLKDSCKLWRTYREGLTTQEAAKRYFGRWTLPEVEKQLGAYKAKLQKLQSDQANAPQARKSIVDSSQLLAESSQMLPQSSPVERSMQARAARRSSAEPPRTTAIQVPSSPPQNNEAGPKPLGTTGKAHQSTQAPRSSSPTVHISVLEQKSARQDISRPSTGNSRQSSLSFSRDKGKQRAGPPRPAFEELDAQYNRHPQTSGTDRPNTQLQQDAEATVAGEDVLPGADEDDDDEHTPADDLDMLDAELRNETADPHAEISKDEQTTDSRQNGLAVTSGDVQASQTSDERKRTNSKDSILQSPITTRDGTASTSSGRRRSRVESGVDTRVAAQLSQELNRSLSREEREELEEAAHENQVFETPNTKINKYRKAAAKPRLSTVASELVPSNDMAIEPESQAFQTQDPTTTRSQRALHATLQAKQAAHGNGVISNHAQRTPTLQPSPHIGSSESGVTPTTTPATTPAQSGRLPARGQSYASRIRELHKPSQPIAAAAAKSLKESSARSSASESSEDEDGEPTDESIWKKTAGAEKLGRNREEYFEDLKISTFSIRAMGRGDWDEVRRLKSEEKRLHRQRKIARGDYVPSARDTQHRDGPAQGGDADQADEDVIRVDDDSAISSDEAEEDDGDGKIWSDDDFEQPQEMDRDRHFSEVEDDEEIVDQPNDAGQRTIEQSHEHEGDGKEVNNINEDEEMVDAADKSEGALQANGIEAAGVHEEDEDELELPTIATLAQVNGDSTHALTDENLQELDNSGAEGLPKRLSRKRKASEDKSSPNAKRNKQQPNSQAAMPPPPKVDGQASAQNKRMSKRQKRRQRHSFQHSGEGRSERSSSFSNQPGSEAPQQHVPSTPVQSGKSADPSNDGTQIKTTPSKQVPKWKTQTPTQPQQPTVAASQKVPVSSAAGTQRSNGGGMSGLAGLVKKAHIPTPPKVKRTPQKKSDKGRAKLGLNAEDDESDESSDSA